MFFYSSYFKDVPEIKKESRTEEMIEKSEREKSKFNQLVYLFNFSISDQANIKQHSISVTGTIDNHYLENNRYITDGDGFVRNYLANKLKHA